MQGDDESAAVARLRANIANDDKFDISHFVLRLLRSLQDRQPISLQSISAFAAAPDHGLCLQVVNWLAGERIVVIAGETVQLTDKGLQSLTAAAASDAALSGFFLNHNLALDTVKANNAVLLVLRSLFEMRRGEDQSDRS